ncbi:MAG: hypothetical protein LBR58_09760 [Propionibacteriaceae bacterium]|jgi:hypothetical protein|nr:hypothetical protein [Propionibacteriaceae bacterium]
MTIRAERLFDGLTPELPTGLDIEVTADLSECAFAMKADPIHRANKPNY